MQLEIVVPDGTVLSAPIRSLQAADASGRFGLWPNHEAFVTVLEPCLVTMRTDDDRERFAGVDGGVLVSERNKVSIACREAVVADRIEDVAVRVGVLLRERRLHEKTARGEFAELQAALLRQLKNAERPR